MNVGIKGLAELNFTVCLSNEIRKSGITNNDVLVRLLELQRPYCFRKNFTNSISQQTRNFQLRFESLESSEIQFSDLIENFWRISPPKLLGPKFTRQTCKTIT